MAVTTGQRLGDVTNLTFDALDRENGKASIQTQKTGEQITTLIHKDFEKWLSTRNCGIGKAPIFPSLAGKKVNGAKGLSQQFRGIMEAAQITEKVIEAAGVKGRTRNSKGFHSFRHTFTSDLANAGVSSEIRQALVGHRDPKVHAGYTHFNDKVLKRAVSKLPKLHA
jgi:integrase